MRLAGIAGMLNGYVPKLGMASRAKPICLRYGFACIENYTGKYMHITYRYRNSTLPDIHIR